MGVNLTAYFTRIGYTGPIEPTLSVLHDLHMRHPAAIAFEALDPLLGRLVEIDTASLEAKLVHGRRGGYCHEHNALFYDVLSGMGFSVTALGARVVWMTPGRVSPKGHRMTLVDLPEAIFIADVGFGGQTPTAPLRLAPGLEQLTSHGTYRVMHEGDVYVTEMKIGDRWEPMYRFTLEAQSRADFEMANWFTSTHPRGRFTRNLIAARVVGPARFNLFNASLTVRGTDGDVEEHLIEGPIELRQVLEDIVGLILPVPAEALWDRLPREPVPPWP